MSIVWQNFWPIWILDSILQSLMWPQLVWVLVFPLLCLTPHTSCARNYALKAYHPISGVREGVDLGTAISPIKRETRECAPLFSALERDVRVFREVHNALCVKKKERETKSSKMHALVNAFMRCLSFLLPPSWLCVSFCLWVGNDCEETPPRPNPRARFKSTKPLTYEEVAAVAAAVEAQGGSSPSVSPGPGCPSLAASSPAAPQGPPSGRIWIGGLWRAVERVFGASWVLRWCPKKRRAALRTPYPVCAFESSKIKSFQGGAAAAAITADGKGPGGTTLTYSRNMSGSVGIPSLKPVECASDVSAEQGIDEVITLDQHTQEMGTVTITVAIQAAEDEEPEEVSCNNVDFLGGSCSEDEMGRHDKSRWAEFFFFFCCT